MDILVDIRGILEIHAWICYGFSEQGNFSKKHFAFNGFLFGGINLIYVILSYLRSIYVNLDKGFHFKLIYIATP